MSNEKSPRVVVTFNFISCAAGKVKPESDEPIFQSAVEDLILPFNPPSNYSELSWKTTSTPIMSPVNPHIVSQLRQLIYYHLDCNLLRNALFLAGRLQAYEPRSSEAVYLLALCHLRLGQLKAAFDTSRISGSRGNHIGCLYVYAQACLGLDKYLEGINAIDRCKSVWTTRNNWSECPTA